MSLKYGVCRICGRWSATGGGMCGKCFARDFIEARKRLDKK